MSDGKFTSMIQWLIPSTDIMKSQSSMNHNYHLFLSTQVNQMSKHLHIFQNQKKKTFMSQNKKAFRHQEPLMFQLIYLQKNIQHEFKQQHCTTQVAQKQSFTNAFLILFLITLHYLLLLSQTLTFLHVLENELMS